jgi:hypothetical protein
MDSEAAAAPPPLAGASREEEWLSRQLRRRAPRVLSLAAAQQLPVNPRSLRRAGLHRLAKLRRATNEAVEGVPTGGREGRQEDRREVVSAAGPQLSLSLSPAAARGVPPPSQSSSSAVASSPEVQSLQTRVRALEAQLGAARVELAGAALSKGGGADDGDRGAGAGWATLIYVDEEGGGAPSVPSHPSPSAQRSVCLACPSVAATEGAHVV